MLVVHVEEMLEDKLDLVVGQMAHHALYIQNLMLMELDVLDLTNRFHKFQSCSKNYDQLF